jgi:hypothetical protein
VAGQLARGDLVGGRLRRLVDQGIQGVTSNPNIIAKAISGSADYDRQLATLAAQGHDAEASYWSLSTTTSTAPWPCCDPSTTAPAAAVGLDLDQDPRLSRHRLRRQPDRP